MIKHEIIQHSRSKKIYIVTFYDMQIIDVEYFKYIFRPYFESKNLSFILDFSNVTDISAEVLGVMVELKSKFEERDSLFILKISSNESYKKIVKYELNKIFYIGSTLEDCMLKINWENNELTEKIRINFSPSFQFMQPVRNFVKSIADIKGFSRNDAYRIQTVVDELCSNAVEHGTWGDGDNFVRLALLVSREKVEVYVHNMTGKKEIDKLKRVYEKDKTDILRQMDSLRGRGIAIVKMLSNKLNVKISENRTIVRVVKYKEVNETKPKVVSDNK